MTVLTELQQQTQAAMAAGDLDEVFDLYESALANGARHDVRVEYAFLLWKCYEYRRAEELFGELVQAEQTETPTRQLIAKSYFLNGRYRNAAEVMKTTVASSESPSAELLVQLASCLERDNQTEASIEAAEKALKQEPENNAAVRQLAHIEKRSGKYAAAVDRIRLHLKSFPNSPNWALRYELASNLDRMGEYAAAWQELVKAKSQLVQQSKADLAVSYQIRERQGKFIQSVTDADLKRWYQTRPEASPPHRITMLAGFPRSGTTLLEQILTSHPNVVGTDETGILTSQFVFPMIWQAADTLAAVMEVRGLENDQLQIGRDNYRRFTESVIGEPIGNRLLIEKDPLMTCDLMIPLRLFPDASIVMPLRDPRDVIVSYFSTMVPINWNSSPATNIVESARFYHDVMRHWLLMRNRLPWPTLETRYEDLVADQSSETKKITDFLNLDFTESMLDEKNRSSEKAVSTPTYDDVTKPIYNRAVGRWKNYKEQLEPVLAILEPYAKTFGYE